MLIVAAGLTALVLVVVGALLVRDHQSRAEEERAVAAAQQEAEARAAEEATAASVARGYLDALAASDAERALTFAAAPPDGNNDLLNQDVLADANDRAPLTGVDIGEVTLTEVKPGVWATGTVQARYAIGDQPQAVDLPVRKVDDGWKLDRVTAPVELGAFEPDRLVNGLIARPGAYNLFPGSYSVTSTNPLIALEPGAFVLPSPIDPNTEWMPKPVLSDQGRTQSLEASKRAVNDCLQSKELKPPNCPFIFWEPGALQIDESTITYSLTNDPWANVTFDFYAGDLTARSTVQVAQRIEAQAVKDGVRGTLQPSEQTNPANLVVNLAAGTPEVSFSGG